MSLLAHSIPSTLFILGPTGSGKSALAVSLAERIGDCEIVSADAYQIYKDLPILTAAPSVREQARVTHHLIHQIELSETHDASVHARMAQRAIADIHSRGKRAIITGGSGLYVKFISHGISEAPPSDLELRAQLEEQDTAQLIEQFNQLDPEGLERTPVENKRYLVRNLEIVLLSGKPLSHWRKNWENKPAIGPGWALQWDVASLDERIAARARLMIESGVCAELQKAKAALALRGRTLSATAKKTLGMSHVEQLILGEISTDECIAKLALATRQYAKRQRTWLRRESWLTSLDAHTRSENELVEEIICKLHP